LSKSGFKLVCNVNIIYGGNLKSGNFQDYASNLNKIVALMDSASCLDLAFIGGIPDLPTFYVHRICGHAAVHVKNPRFYERLEKNLVLDFRLPSCLFCIEKSEI
jgi:hypothetical protein